jgi:hypothetical protein
MDCIFFKGVKTHEQGSTKPNLSTAQCQATGKDAIPEPPYRLAITIIGKTPKTNSNWW